MGKKGVVIPVILILLAAICWWAVISKERALARSQEKTHVLVAGSDLPADTVLKEDLVEVMAIPRVYMQQDAYEVRSMTDINLVTGLVSAVRIPKGNQITRSCLVSLSPKAGTGVKVPPAQQHYLEGLKYLQNADYKKAREELTIAKKLDPSNADAEAGLKRINQILAGSK
ncbi:MAG: hypothetical protein NTX59_09475 [Elusimicrobia bacterium]|nr:hypothetical protein [Elusimicrobiota bacterium]